MNKLLLIVLVLTSSLFTACSSTPTPQPQTQNGYSLMLSPDTLTAAMEQQGEGVFISFGSHSYLCTLVSLVTPSGEIVPVKQGQHFADINYAHGFALDYAGLKPYRISQKKANVIYPLDEFCARSGLLSFEVC